MNVGSNWFNSLTESLLSHRRYIPAALTLGIGTSLSLAASALMWHSENQRMQVQFHEQADRLNVTLQQSINNNLEVLYSLQAFYNASTEVSKQDFKQFVWPTLSRNLAIHSLNWIRRVPAAQKAAYEAAIRSQGFPAFQIYERTPDNKQVKAKVRSEYYPIAYREALEEDPKVIGFDVASSPDRSWALEKSVNTGKIAASGRITLVSNDQPGLQVFLPVPRRTTSLDNSVKGRQNVRGVIAGLFQITSMVDFSLESLNLDSINFYLYDNSATGKERFLVRYDSQTKQLIDNPKLSKPELTNLRGKICQNPSACTRLFNVADR